MNYDDYDAFGNYIGKGKNPTTTVETVTDENDDVYHSSSAAATTSAAAPKAAATNGDDSDGWSDVEVITQQGPTDDISVPLVQSAQAAAVGAGGAVGGGGLLGIADGAAVLMITAGTSASGGAASSTTAKTEAQKHADAISFVVGATAKMRNVAVVGDIHSGKSSLARLIGSAAAEIEGQFDELTNGKTRKQTHFGTSASPKAAAAAALVPFQAATEQEAARLTTLRTHTFSCLVSGERTLTTHLINLADTPGHTSLIADALSAVRATDCVVVCVDASGTVGAHAEQLIRRAVLQQIRVVLCLTKLDRLVLDLHLPPQTVYVKCRMLIDAVNNIIASCGVTSAPAAHHTTHAPSSAAPTAPICPLVSPVNGTVWFTSAKMNLFFTLDTFARKYSEVYRNINVATLAARLWGPIRYDIEERKFAKVTMPTQRTSFVTLILEPLYKVISHSIGGEAFTLLNNALSAAPKSPWSAVREAVTLYCGSFHKMAVDALIGACEAPARRNAFLRSQYQIDCDADGETVHVASGVVTGVLFANTTAASSSSSSSAGGPSPPVAAAAAAAEQQQQLVQTRVINSVLKKGDRVLIYQRSPTTSEVEHESTPQATVEAIYVRTAVGLVEVPDAIAGMTVFIGSSGIAQRLGAPPHALLVAVPPAPAPLMPGVPSVFGGMAPLTGGASANTAASIPSAALDRPLLHISVQPQATAKEARLFEKAVRKVTLRYPGLAIGKEETGLYTLSGAGELQFEAALTDLRRYECSATGASAANCASSRLLAHDAVKLSSFVDDVGGYSAQPYVTFCETVANKRGTSVLAVHPPGRHASEQLAMTAHRMEDKLRLAVEHNTLPLDVPEGADAEDPDYNPMLPLFTCLRHEHGWDILAAGRGLLSIGPDRTRGGTNIIVDDSIDGDWLEEDNFSSAEAVVEGFKAAALRGPLCDEEVRGVHFSLIGGPVPFSPHLVQHSRLCALKAMLGANPRLMEPVLAAEVLTPPAHVGRIKDMFTAKRGNVVAEAKVPASPLVVVRGYCPAIDHFGLETKMRAETNGEAFPTFSFDHWAAIDSDPYDAALALELQRPARGAKIARDFVMRTRMRKGLKPKPEDIDIQ